MTLAPEGGAHQSIGTPLIGIAQDGLPSFEPAFVDELTVIFAFALDVQAGTAAPQPPSATGCAMRPVGRCLSALDAAVGQESSGQ